MKRARRAAAGFALALAAALSSGCATFHQGAMPGEPRGSTFMKIGGARIRYIDEGEGPPVVLVHGFASSLDAWTPMLAELEKRHRVIALDLKGFGWSDRPEGDYSPAAEARIVLGLMKRRGVDRAAIVAHSWGSSIALAAALDSPERVSRIALYDAWVYEDQLPTFFVMSRADGVGEALFNLFYTERPDEKLTLAFYDKHVVTEKLAEDVERAMDRPGTVAAALAAVRGQRYEEIERRYHTIDKPTLLLWGREDVVTPVRYGERLSKELPRAKLVVYPQCGHFPMIEARSASTAELVRFLDEPDAAAPPAAIKVDASAAEKPRAPAPAAVEDDAEPPKERR